MIIGISGTKRTVRNRGAVADPGEEPGGPPPFFLRVWMTDPPPRPSILRSGIGTEVSVRSGYTLYTIKLTLCFGSKC